MGNNVKNDVMIELVKEHAAFIGKYVEENESMFESEEVITEFAERSMVSFLKRLDNVMQLIQEGDLSTDGNIVLTPIEFAQILSITEATSAINERMKLLEEVSQVLETNNNQPVTESESDVDDELNKFLDEILNELSVQ